MNFLRRLFRRSNTTHDTAIHLYVRCGRCSAPVHVRIDPRNDLMPEYNDDEYMAGYRLIKEIMDARCFRLMRAEIEYDHTRREIKRQLEGGSFLSKEEYERLVAQSSSGR